jgi:hypothetical protein
MALDREALFVALFGRLQTQLGSAVASYSRRAESWDDTRPTSQPALLLIKGPEHSRRQGPGLGLLWVLHAQIWLYVKDDGTNRAVPSTQIHALLNSIESALEIQPSEATLGNVFVARRDPPPAGTTLGGLCLRCEIVGEIAVHEGTMGHEAVVMIPVEIEAPA